MQRRSARVPYEHEYVRIEYNLDSAARGVQEITVILEKDQKQRIDIVYRWLAACLLNWSIATDGVVAPITVEALQDLPVRLVALMAQEIVDDLDDL